MIEIENKLLSEDLFEEFFCCDLTQCKGECCIDGDSGAPLDEEEIDIIAHHIEAIKPFMRPEGVCVIEELGVSVIDFEGDNTTPLIYGAECAFVVKDGDIACCAIEEAVRAGGI